MIMKYALILLFVTSHFFKIQSLRYSPDPLSAANGSRSVCPRVYSLRTPQYVPYEETYKHYSGLFYSIKKRTNYKIEYQTYWDVKNECCDGYIQLNGMCVAECQPNCKNGYCYEPNICHCYSGYNKSPTKPKNNCVPICDNECIQGTCIRPNVCSCDYGYKLEADNFTCSPDCYGICDETEYCAGPKDCQCIAGYRRFELTTKSTNISELPNFDSSHHLYGKEDNVTLSTLFIPRAKCVPVCDKSCVNSDCVAPNVCQCYDGYGRIEDDIFKCVPVCNKSCHFGTCTAPNVCTCYEGYGPNTTRGSHICEPICSKPCINGNCIAPESCSCFDGYAFLNVSKYSCEPICSQTCKNGHCTEPEVCTCNPGYEKSTIDYTCKLKCECINGVCLEPNNICTCNAGFSFLNNGNTTFCAPKCDNGCINGNCIAPEVCECRDDYILVNDTNGNVSCIDPCETCANGICLAQENMCQCYYGWSGDNCDDPYLCRLEINETVYRIINNEEQLITIYHNDNSKKIGRFPWDLPNCSKKCESEINNVTECYLSYQNNNSKVICFLNIGLECNTVDLTFEGRYKTSKIPLIVGLVISILGAASAITILLITRRIKLNRQNQFATQCVTTQQGEATDCLLEDDGYL